MDKIYDMKLHEEVVTNQGCVIMRVPGGWIFYAKNGQVGVFVPYIRERLCMKQINKPTDDEIDTYL